MIFCFGDHRTRGPKKRRRAIAGADNTEDNTFTTRGSAASSTAKCTFAAGTAAADSTLTCPIEIATVAAGYQVMTLIAASVTTGSAVAAGVYDVVQQLLEVRIV